MTELEFFTSSSSGLEQPTSPPAQIVLSQKERAHWWLTVAQVLQTVDLAHKCAVTHSMWRALVEERLPVGSASPPEAPARPLLPKVMYPVYVCFPSRFTKL